MGDLLWSRVWSWRQLPVEIIISFFLVAESTLGIIYVISPGTSTALVFCGTPLTYSMENLQDAKKP